MAGYESWKKPLRPYNFYSLICSETESMLSHAKSCLAHRTGASGKRSFSQNYPANMPFWCLCGATAVRKLGYIMPTVNPQFAQYTHSVPTVYSTLVSGVKCTFGPIRALLPKLSPNGAHSMPSGPRVGLPTGALVIIKFHQLKHNSIYSN